MTNLEDTRSNARSFIPWLQATSWYCPGSVHKPKVLILDEPINGLDPIQIAEMRDLILSLKGKHTVILSSHILSEITRTCDRILVIDDGQLVAEGREEDLLAQGDSNIHIDIDVAINEAVVERIKTMENVTELEWTSEGGVICIELRSKKDIRSELAKLLVSEGGSFFVCKRKTQN